MNEQDWVTQQFEAHRAHLQAVAYRMLGSRSEAEDAVQEAWLRLSRSESQDIANLGGWLTTVVGRVCLDMLRSRKARREAPLDMSEVESTTSGDGAGDPESEASFADSVGVALLVVLETLKPAERVAFVLHDLFNLPFEEIAPILKRSPAAVRQLASRARRRVQGRSAAPDVDVGAQMTIVDAFLAASRSGDLTGLLAVLDQDVVFRADNAATQLGGGAVPEIRGAGAVAGFFKGRAQAALLSLVDGDVGLLIPRDGQLLLVLRLEIKNQKIVSIEVIADRESLRELDLSAVDGAPRSEEVRQLLGRRAQ